MQAIPDTYLEEVGLSLSSVKTFLFGWKAAEERIEFDLPLINVAFTHVPPTPINTPIL